MPIGWLFVLYSVAIYYRENVKICPIYLEDSDSQIQCRQWYTNLFYLVTVKHVSLQGEGLLPEDWLYSISVSIIVRFTT